MQNVSKSFAMPRGRIEVLHEVNFSVFQGEFVAVTGPSGSGKSTFLNLAALLDHPTTGGVQFDGQDVSQLAEAEMCRLRKKKIGMVFQKYCLLPHRTVLENVLFRFRYLDHDRFEAEQRCLRILTRMGLMNITHRCVRFLSGGEMQRVAIARAVALEPRLLIADEPTGNLDRAAATAVMDCFKQLNDAGISILMATHNEALLNFCTRHILCQGGSIVH
jgi:putative ABC transport system ATP-binding protein